MYTEETLLNYEKILQTGNFKDKTFVIKYGGSIMDNADAQDAFIEDIITLKKHGIKIIIVHGGGPEISKWLKRTGVASNFINGLRVTDRDTMEIVEMVLSGNVNKKLSSNLSIKGLDAIGISGKDCNLLTVKKKYTYEAGKSIDLGFVGEVTAINNKLLCSLLDNDIIPVISPIGSDLEGNSYNVNADYAAAFISGAHKAEKLFFMTDIDGVYKDIKNPSTLLPSITIKEIEDYIKDGTITGGMIPKLECCTYALKKGTQSVHLVNGIKPHNLLANLGVCSGTKILYEKGEN